MYQFCRDISLDTQTMPSLSNLKLKKSMANERVEANEYFEHACEDREPKESSEKNWGI